MGEQVLLEATNLQTTHPKAKLAPRCYGPFKVIWASATNCKLELLPQMRIYPVFHNSLLEPYKETKEHGPNFACPPPEIIAGEEGHYCYVSPPSFSPSPTSVMPLPTPSMPSAPQTMTPMTSNTMLSTLPPIHMAALPSSDPVISQLPGDTLLYGQHRPSSIVTHILQHHYVLPPWPADRILDQSGCA